MIEVNWVAKEQNVHLLEYGKRYIVTLISPASIPSVRVFNFNYLGSPITHGWQYVTAFDPTPTYDDFVPEREGIKPSRLLDWREYPMYEQELIIPKTYLVTLKGGEISVFTWINDLGSWEDVIAFHEISTRDDTLPYYFDAFKPPQVETFDMSFAQKFINGDL